MLPDLAALDHFHFLRPAWALALLPTIIILWWLRRRQNSRDMFDGIIAPHLLEHLRVERFESRWFNPATMGSLLGVLMMLVVLGPSWRQQPSPLSQDEAALVILLDVSRSMQQQDVQPSRLQRARQKISDLLALRPDKKAALLVYAGSAHTVLTLTADQDILNQYLAALEPGIMPRAGKFPEYGLPLVDQVLRDTAAPATVVLFADGHGADSRAAFADYFTTRPHQLLVVGVGSEQPGAGLLPLERRDLERLADDSGGRYYPLTVDDSDMRRISRRIDSHYVIVDDDALPWLDSGYPLVFACLGIFLLWFRKGWTITWAWLLAPWLLLAPAERALAQAEAASVGSGAHPVAQWLADLWLTPDQQGRLLLQLGHYQEAARHFEDPLWKGLAYYYAEEFMVAAQYFSRADSDDALFNEANARAHARDYVRAVHRYDRLLARSPDYPGAAANRARVQALIDDINRLSESQQAEPGVSGEDRELGGDDAIPAEGADDITWQEAELLQLSAEDVLQNKATADMWLRSVQRDPSDFLAIKFSMQLQRQEQQP
jgi:Ca-activated chloride channel family protein